MNDIFLHTDQLTVGYHGEALIREYYNIAPGIVTCINTCSDRHASYARIREEYLAAHPRA